LTDPLHRRTGFEIELVAPPGSTRRTLADALAHSCGGQVRPVWHEDSEPAAAAGFGGRFLHLTQGFEVLRDSGATLCTLVDDITIAADLDRSAPAPPGWHRLLTDDLRLLRLLGRHSDPGGSLATSLDRMASLWGSPVEQLGNVYRLETVGATIALAAPAGGERERPCEIVTPPLTEDHSATLEGLLGPARALGFSIPQEAAVHVHVDGGPFRQAGALANVVRLFAHWREPLHRLLGTNPRCQRLAPLPASLVAAADGRPTIDTLRAAAKAGGLSKFYDVNLIQLLSDTPLRDTLEVRILPGAIDGAAVVAGAAVVERLLDRCCETEPFPAPPPDPDEAFHELSALTGSHV
jgi:Putative amidoligase enzyme